jgi:DNA-binding transcriptional LysR family regulator
MDLKYDDLKTFLAIYRLGTFTRAASELGLSQSALSQKVARIEQTLQAAVFVRHPRSLSLTATGEKLLSYAKEALQMQRDFLDDYNQYENELSGVIRVAGYSSIMRSLIIPKVAAFQRAHPKVSIEYSSYEMFELSAILKTNKADFILTDNFLTLAQTEEEKIGEEEYVIIEAKKYKNAPEIFLDHTPLDNATESYFNFIGNKEKYKRAFMGDVYSIIDGVVLGLGKAVMSKHLIKDNKKLLIKDHKKKFIRPIVLTYLKQNYYGPLHQSVRDCLNSDT